MMDKPHNSTLVSAVKKNRSSSATAGRIALAISACLMLPACATANLAIAQDAPAPMTQIVDADAELSEVWADVEAAMAESQLHGLSVAVFENYRLVDVQTFGVKSVGEPDLIDVNTAYSTASISKAVTGLLCIMLEEEGLIDLDAPVADYLTSWQLPDGLDEEGQRITIRHLLTHTAGTSQHGFADFYEGDTLSTLVDSLEGRIPRYDGPIAPLFAPGTDWQYSGGGYVIVQLALEDRFGLPLSQLAADRIFKPIGMEHTTMVQPGSPGFPDNAASVHDADGQMIRTGLPITPQIAASGMWSTPADLAVFAMAIQTALAGNENSPITPFAARSLTDIFSLEHVGGMSMPFFRGFGFGNTDWFRHDGSNTGVNADLIASMDGGYGFILLGNGDDANTAPVFAMLRRRIIEQMGWSKFDQNQAQPLAAALRDALPGSYRGLLYDLGMEYHIEESDGRWWISSQFFSQFLGTDKSEMIHLGDGVFVIEDYPNHLRFELDEAGEISRISTSRAGSEAPDFVRPIEAVR